MDAWGRVVIAALALCIVLGSEEKAAAGDDTEVGCTTTEWKLLGANHKVCVYSFADPDLPGITCYISQARTGGVSGSLGLAEDPSNFAISCSRTGEVSVPDDFPKQANVYKESTSLFFKATRVVRMWDKARHTLIYLAVSKRLVNGSPYNAVSVVPIGL